MASDPASKKGYELGEVYEALGRRGDSKTAHGNVLEMDPENAAYHRGSIEALRDGAR